MPRKDLSFRIELPISVPSNTVDVCVAWINKRGRSMNISIIGEKHIIKFATIKFVLQNNLLRSLRVTLVKKGLGHVCDLAHIYCCIPFLVTPTREQLETRVDRLEGQVHDLSLRPTTINNNINNVVVLQNFGDEDFSFLNDPREYLEKTLGGLRSIMKDAFFNDDQAQNHTARLNLATNVVEVHLNGEWKPTEMPLVADRMIGSCRTFIIKGFNPHVHQHSVDVKEFITSMNQNQTIVTEPLRADISEGLIARQNVQVEEFNAKFDAEHSNTRTLEHSNTRTPEHSEML